VGRDLWAGVPDIRQLRGKESSTSARLAPKVRSKKKLWGTPQSEGTSQADKKETEAGPSDRGNHEKTRARRRGGGQRKANGEASEPRATRGVAKDSGWVYGELQRRLGNPLIGGRGYLQGKKGESQRRALEGKQPRHFNICKGNDDKNADTDWAANGDPDTLGGKF